jgi:uncharacterized protein (DUF2252 family)
MKDRVAALYESCNEEKRAKIASSPYAFFRGTAELFYERLFHSAAGKADLERPHVLSNGDVHPQNFGVVPSSDGPRGDHVHVALNDFDESCHAPFSVDLERCATGLALLAHQRHLKPRQVDETIAAFVEAYLEENKKLDEDRKRVDKLYDRDHATGEAKKMLDDAHRDGRKKFFDHYVDGDRLRAHHGGHDAHAIHDVHDVHDVHDDHAHGAHGGHGGGAAHSAHDAHGARVDLDHGGSGAPKGVVVDGAHAHALLPAPEMIAAMRDSLGALNEGLVVRDVARRIGSGTASAGLARYYVLCAVDDHDVILEVKLGAESTLRAFIGTPPLARLPGEAAARAQRQIASAWARSLTFDGHSWLVRERCPQKATIAEDVDADGLVDWASTCGLLLARGHARSTEGAASAVRETVVKLKEQRGKGAFLEDIATFARDAAEQTVRDHAIVERLAR